MLCLSLQWNDVSELARANPRVLAASRTSADEGGVAGGGAVGGGVEGIPEGIPSADMAVEGAQKLGRFVTSTASMVGERATGAAGVAASGDITAADAAAAVGDAAGEAAAMVGEKAKALGTRSIPPWLPLLSCAIALSCPVSILCWSICRRHHIAKTCLPTYCRRTFRARV